MNVMNQARLASPISLLLLLACGGPGPSGNEAENVEEALRRGAACERFNERQCLAHPNACEPVYVEVGTGCACAACPAGETCPPCDCPPPAPPVRQFQSCQKVDPCSRLDELACRANESCEPVVGACPLGPCVEGDPASCECSPSVIGCRTKLPPPPPVCRQGSTNCGPTPAPGGT
jgi:hypothetical protein